MKTFLIAVVAIFLSASAFAEAPTDESISELLSLTHHEAIMDSMYAALEQSMRQGLKQAVSGRSLTPEQERALDLAPSKLIAALRQDPSDLRATIVQIYKDTFDQEEVDGLIAFYKSPVGRSTITKMPLVLQRSMQAGQTRMQQLLPRIRVAMEEALKEAGVSK